MKAASARFITRGLLRMAALLSVITLAPVVLWLSVGLHPAARALATSEWWPQVWALYGESADRSLRLAATCVAAAMLVAMPCAQFCRQSRAAWVARCAAFLQCPMAVPTLATALALLLAATPPRGLAQDFAFVLLAHLVLTLPFVVQRMAAALALQGNEARTSRDPSAVARAALSACLLAFALSLGESSLTALLGAPLAPPWPAGLAALRGEAGTACAAMAVAIALPLLWGLRTIAEALGSDPVKPSSAGRS